MIWKYLPFKYSRILLILEGMLGNAWRVYLRFVFRLILAVTTSDVSCVNLGAGVGNSVAATVRTCVISPECRSQQGSLMWFYRQSIRLAIRTRDPKDPIRILQSSPIIVIYFIIHQGDLFRFALEQKF